MGDVLKALTLWRPWPWAIFHAPTNPKRIENRPWKPWPSIIDRRIALHAGKTFDSDAAEDLCSMYSMHPDGAPPYGWKHEGLIGVVTIQGTAGSFAEAERFSRGQGEWFSGPYAWLLKDVLAFPEPIPCRGAQGLWDLPPEAEKKVSETLRAMDAARKAGA